MAARRARPTGSLIEDNFYPGLDQALDDAAAEGDTVEEHNAPEPPPPLASPGAPPQLPPPAPADPTGSAPPSSEPEGSSATGSSADQQAALSFAVQTGSEIEQAPKPRRKRQWQPNLVRWASSRRRSSRRVATMTMTDSVLADHRKIIEHEERRLLRELADALARAKRDCRPEFAERVEMYLRERGLLDRDGTN